MESNSLTSTLLISTLFIFIMITTLRVRKQISKKIYDITNPRSSYHRAVYKNKKRK